MVSIGKSVLRVPPSRHMHLVGSSKELVARILVWVALHCTNRLASPYHPKYHTKRPVASTPRIVTPPTIKRVEYNAWMQICVRRVLG